MKRDNNMYWFCYRYCGMHFKEKNKMSFHRFNDQCQGWFALHTLKMYLTFDKNDQTTLKAALDERSMRFPLKYVGREIKGFHSGEKNKNCRGYSKKLKKLTVGDEEKKYQLHARGVGEVRARRSRGREEKKTMEGNHPDVAKAKKKRKVINLADI